MTKIEIETQKVNVQTKLSELLSGDSSTFWKEISEWLDSYILKSQDALLNAADINTIIHLQEGIKIARVVINLPQLMRSSLEAAIAQLNEGAEPPDGDYSHLNLLPARQGVKGG